MSERTASAAGNRAQSHEMGADEARHILKHHTGANDRRAFARAMRALVHLDSIRARVTAERDEARRDLKTVRSERDRYAADLSAELGRSLKVRNAALAYLETVNRLAESADTSHAARAEYSEALEALRQSLVTR